MSSAQSPSPPPWASLLGLAGLAPFLAGAAALWSSGAQHAPFLGWALAAYAATIAAFLGGVHWGPALRDGAREAMPLVWGVVAQLLAWAALLLPQREGLLLLGSLLLLIYAVDRQLYPRAGLQAWLPLRLKLTLGATLSCWIGAAAV